MPVSAGTCVSVAAGGSRNTTDLKILTAGLTGVSVVPPDGIYKPRVTAFAMRPTATAEIILQSLSSFHTKCLIHTRILNKDFLISK